MKIWIRTLFLMLIAMTTHWVSVDGKTNNSLDDDPIKYTAKYTDTSGKVSSLENFPTNLKKGTYQLLDDVICTGRLTPIVTGSDITLDLNGHTLTSTASDYAILLSRTGTETNFKIFKIIDSSENGGGKLTVNNKAKAAIQIQGKYNVVTIGKGVTIDGGCVAVLSENDVLNVEGTIIGGNDFAVATNGSETKNATINIKSTANLQSNVTAVYLPGAGGTTTIEEGSKITGSTGVYIKSGSLNITGGEITGNGDKKEYVYNGNGANSTGNAVVVDNCGYPGGAPNVSITGGFFTSTYSKAIGSYKYGDDNEKIVNFISGSYFSDLVEEDLLAEDLICYQATNQSGYYVVSAVSSASLLVFHDSGTYDKAFDVPMFTNISGADIYYKVNGGGDTKYTGPVSISATTELEAWLVLNGEKIGNSVTRSYTITTAADGPTVTDGYYYITNNGNGKYVNVAGRKTVTFLTEDAAKTAAGTVIKVKATNGKLEVLRSQAVDLPGYAKRAMNYVPEMVQLIVDKLHADGSGAILGTTGYEAIMEKFNESFDYNLYLEGDESGYRIYGRTPSMKPIVDFYAEHKAQVDEKLTQLEGFINNAITKLLNKLENHGASVLQPFSLLTVWEAMGGTLTKPEDTATTAQFYEEVLSSEANVWSFAYETAMIYYNLLMDRIENGSSGTYQQLIDNLGDYKKYLDKLPQIRPNFKYYIVAEGNKIDFKSEGNTDITSNAASTSWTLTARDNFTMKFNEEEKLVDGAGTKYYTTLYTDFAYTMPENAKAYVVEDISEVNEKDYAQLKEITGVIPAQTPVLLMTQDESLVATLALSTETGTAPENNLLKGADWVINEYNLQTEQLHDMFELVKENLGESFYNNYIVQYEHLLALNAGTVNNKYFFGLKDAVMENVTNIRQLVVEEDDGTNVLAFWDNYGALPANKAFIIDEHIPLLLPLWPDVNRDGTVNVSDITAIVDIILNNDAEEIFPNYDFVAADINGDGSININDVTALVDIVLELSN